MLNNSWVVVSTTFFFHPDRMNPVDVHTFQMDGASTKQLLAYVCKAYPILQGASIKNKHTPIRIEHISWFWLRVEIYEGSICHWMGLQPYLKQWGSFGVIFYNNSDQNLILIRYQSISGKWLTHINPSIDDTEIVRHRTINSRIC